MRACEIKTVLDLGRQSASFRESRVKKILTLLFARTTMAQIVSVSIGRYVV